MGTNLAHLDRVKAQARVAREIARVARGLNVKALTGRQYHSHGGAYLNWIESNWSWNQAVRAAGLEVTNEHNIPGSSLLMDLRHVAFDLGSSRMTEFEYLERGRYSLMPFLRAFGTWNAAMEAANLDTSRGVLISQLDFFANIQHMWTQLNRRPRYSEMRGPHSEYHGRSYSKRFGSWEQALEAFAAFLRCYLETNSVSAYEDPDRSRLAKRSRNRRVARARADSIQLSRSFARHMLDDITEALAAGLRGLARNRARPGA